MSSRIVEIICEVIAGDFEEEFLKQAGDIQSFCTFVYVGVFFRMSQIVFFGYLLFDITLCDENF